MTTAGASWRADWQRSPQAAQLQAGPAWQISPFGLWALKVGQDAAPLEWSLGPDLAWYCSVVFQFPEFIIHSNIPEIHLNFQNS
jgi:hypothetical protein